MNVPDGRLPPIVKREINPFSEGVLLADFKRFISQREIGRPFPQQITKGRNEESFAILARAVEGLNINQEDIETFSKAIDYFCEVEQSSGFYYLNIRGPQEFAAIRKKMIDMLNSKTPASEREFEFFISVYTLLRLPEPSGLLMLWRKRKDGVYDEFSYLKSIEIPKAVLYIRKRLAQIK